MRAFILLLFIGFTATAHAALPPEVQSLQNAVSKAEDAQLALQKHLAAQREKNAATLKQQFRLTTLQLRLNQWPDNLLLTQAILSVSPTPATTLTQTLHRQTAGQLAAVTAKLSTLTTLQLQAQSQLTQLQALQGEFAGANNRLSQLEKSALYAARADADILASVLTQNLSTTAPQTTLPSTLSNTARLPVAGRLEIAYNTTLPGGGHSEGLTFRAAPSSTVTAITGGTVLYAGPFRNLGGLVIVKNGNRHMVYGGLATLAVTAGGQVQPQTPLGTLADTPPARLYLEVRNRGNTIDPTPLLTAAE